MGDVKIDDIGSDPFQALLHLVNDRVLAEVAMNGAAVVIEEMISLLGMRNEPAFRRQEHAVPAATNRLTDKAFVLSVLIDGRGVQMPNAEHQCPVDRRARLVIIAIAVPANHTHAAET